jgi:hypothetical protein
MPESYPRPFSAKHSLAESKARFTAPRPIKSIVLNLSVSAKNFAIYSNVEALLVKYEFSDLANALKHNRIVQTSVVDFLKSNPTFENDYEISQVALKVEG